MVSSRKNIRIQVAIILAVVGAVYYNALYDGFVYDDYSQVLQNPWIANPHHIIDVFLNTELGYAHFTSNYYRPVMHVIHMLCYQLFGFNAWGYHLINIALHAGTSVLVLFLVSRLGLSYPFDLLAALLFAVNPIHTEAVTWISGITDVSMTFFCILSIYLYTFSGDGPFLRDRYRMLSVSVFFVALFCKEPALLLPGIILTYDYAFGSAGNGGYNLSKAVRRLVPYMVVSCVYLAIRYYAVGGVAPRNWHAGMSAYQDVINALPLFAWYLLKLLLPVNLDIFHTFHPLTSVLDPKALVSLAVLLAYPFACIAAYKRDRLVFLGLCIVAWPLLFSLYIPALGMNVFAERYLNLPVLGFAIIAASLIARTGRINVGKTVSVAMAVAVLSLYSTGTIARNGAYRNDLSLWSDTVRKSPDADIAHYNLGAAYMNIPGYMDKAIRQLRIATRLEPQYSGAFNSLGAAYMSEGDTSDAIKAFRSAVRLAPDNPVFHNNLGIALKKAKLYAMAVKELSEALRLDPSNARIRKNLLEISEEAGRGR